MQLMRGLLSLAFIAALAILPVIESAYRRSGVEGNETKGSLRGVLRALERRRRASTGPYSLASFQDHEDPQDIADYLEARNEYQAAPISSKALLLSYLNKEEYPSEELGPIYKSTIFRERNDQLKEHLKNPVSKKSSSAFREREAKQNYQNEDLQELFLKNLVEKEEEEREESDSEYAELLKRLWDKYKYTHPESYDRENLGPYKERSIRKRQIPGDYIPNGGWGPIAFKRKRSSKQRLDTSDNPDFLYSLKFASQQDPSVVENLKDDKIVDEEEDPDISKIINANGLEPRYSPYEMSSSQTMELDDDPKLNLQPLSYQDEIYLPDGSEIIESPVGSENLYPITKRSNPSNQRFTKRNLSKQFKSLVTNPKIAKDLSSVFGDTIQKPVKRSSNDDSHESKSPIISATSHHRSNESHESLNDTDHDVHDHPDHSHDLPHSRHEHENKPPLLTHSESDHSHEGKPVPFDDNEETHIKLEHPIILKKKSIDWSKYFGIDKRKKKSFNDFSAREYIEKAKRLVMDSYRNMETMSPPSQENLKLDNIDNKLKNMETAMVDEAIDYDSGADGLDTKEEQEMKEKILSRMAAAYNLDKMRKALKEIKLSFQNQRDSMKDTPHDDGAEDKEKRQEAGSKEVKHELDQEDIKELEDNLFENEQGAGHFSNEPVEIMSEGSMGKNRYIENALLEDNLDGSCPMLDRIIRRCQNIDELAGDHGMLFLPLCSLHQICYLCGPSSQTGCDLMFVAEAHSACRGNSACQMAARETLMALREFHSPMIHHLRGECTRQECLTRRVYNNKLLHQPVLR